MIAQWANEYVGTPYQFGAMDCWGLVCKVLEEQYNKMLPRYQTNESTPSELAKLISENKKIATMVDVPDIGDLVIYKLAGCPCHVGIYIGDGFMLHSLKGHSAVLERYKGSRWAKRFEGAYHVD